MRRDFNSIDRADATLRMAARAVTLWTDAAANALLVVAHAVGVWGIAWMEASRRALEAERLYADLSRLSPEERGRRGLTRDKIHDLTFKTLVGRKRPAPHSDERSPFFD